MKVSNAVSLLASIAIVVSCFASSKQETGRESAIAAPGQVLRDHPDCKVDLTGAVSSSDIVSNALVRGLRLPARDVREFLDGAKKKYTTVAELMKATAARFQLKEDVLAAKVEKYKHCNCSHPVESKLHPILRVDMQTHPKCPLDLELGGMMRDTISNVLTLALKVPEQDVREFLDAFKPGVDDGPELFQAAAVRFGFSEDALAAEVQKFRHSDCMHDGGGRKGGAGREGGDRLPDDGRPVSTFAKDVTLHVVLHEIGHGLIREFDLPVLANEETMADAFATYYLTTQLPNRALDVLVARTQS
ncbi:MAG: hypothetical protein IPJ77_07530 [Planctomycetes bacterium]|nr:hypothetical protein [Planctomycetota bacterium]